MSKSTRLAFAHELKRLVGKEARGMTLREKIEAWRDEAERECESSPGVPPWAKWIGRVQAFNEILAALDEEPPRDVLAEVEGWVIPEQAQSPEPWFGIFHRQNASDMVPVHVIILKAKP